MVPGVVSMLCRPEIVRLQADDLALLDRVSARGFINVATREMPRARAQLRGLCVNLIILTFAQVQLHWNGGGLLGFVIGNAVITLLVDVLRRRLADPWVTYSLTRESEMAELLTIARCVELGRETRPRAYPLTADQVYRFAVLGTVVALPLVLVGLTLMGWINWSAITRNEYWIPAMVIIGLLRMTREWLHVRFIKSTPVGALSLTLEADDVLDVYALTLLLALLFLPLGKDALVALAFAVVAARLLIRASRYGWQWRSLRMLGRLVSRRQADSGATAENLLDLDKHVAHAAPGSMRQR